MANKGNCKVDACGKDVVGKGYCARHYKMWRQGKMPKARYDTCVAPECRAKAVNKMRCEKHQKVQPAAEAAATPAAAPAAAPAEAAAEG
jgi:hypothetical protein